MELSVICRMGGKYELLCPRRRLYNDRQCSGYSQRRLKICSSGFLRVLLFCSQCDSGVTVRQSGQKHGYKYKSPFGTTINDTHAAFYFNSRSCWHSDGTGLFRLPLPKCCVTPARKIAAGENNGEQGINDAAADRWQQCLRYSKYKSMRRYRSSLPRGIAAGCVPMMQT